MTAEQDTDEAAAQPASGIPIIPEQLTNMRDRRALSREDLAEKVGELLFDRDAFMSVLSGDAPADARTARALWLTLGCRPQDLVTGLPGMARADVPLWLRRNDGWTLDTGAVKAQRTVRGWTESQLADAVARHWFSRDAVNKIERGERRPKARTLRAICMILRCRPEQLMAGSRPLPDGATTVHRDLLGYNKAMRAWADSQDPPIPYRDPVSKRIRYGRPTDPDSLVSRYARYLDSQRDEALAS